MIALADRSVLKDELQAHADDFAGQLTEFSEMRADYTAARPSRFRTERTSIPYGGASGDYHIRREYDLLKIMELARDLDRNNPIVTALFDRAVGNLIQEGFTVDPQTPFDPDVGIALKALWNDWAEDPDQCDIGGYFAFSDYERLICRHILCDGGISILPTNLGSLQPIEDHRLRTPPGWTNPADKSRACIHGIVIDKNRRHQAFYYTKADIDPSRPVGRKDDFHKYPARDRRGNRNVYYIAHPKRFSQTRGISALAPIFDPVGMLYDIQFATLLHQQIVSCVVGFLEHESGWQAPGGGGSTLGTVAPDGYGDDRLQIKPGRFLQGKPGEKFQMSSPNVPNPEFFPHMRLVMQQISIAIGLPLQLVMLDASDTNFSGWRGAMDQARIGFRQIQRSLINRFYRHVYRWKVRDFIRRDPALRAVENRHGAAIFRHKWTPAAWRYIDPLKDATAELVQSQNNLTSQRRLSAVRGEDYDETMDETITDRGKAIMLAKKKADELNAAHPGLNLTWRDLWREPTADGVNISITDFGEVSSQNNGGSQ